MSPPVVCYGYFVVYFPRVSGDEPEAFGAMTDLYIFSPRERG